jgi:hypothetical protein
MGTQTPNPGGQQQQSNQTPDRGGRSDQTAPGKPSSRQPPDANTGKGQEKDQGRNRDMDEGQEIPKTGRARTRHAGVCRTA